MSKPRVALTVDVEAHPIRAANDHVERLIWGRQNGREAGIQSMMDIADKHGARMTFFLDYPEYELYGEDLLDVGREVFRRGHDLQPHCHAEYLMKPLFGLDNEWAIRLPTASREQSGMIVDYLFEKHAMCGAPAPLAYRSGAYLIGPHYLDALKAKGIKLDASYNISNPENPFSIGLRGQFEWTNGLWELPIPIIPYFAKRNYLVGWNFNFKGFLSPSVDESVAMHLRFLDTWLKRHGEGQIPTLVMHSWSFWGLDEKGRISVPAANAPAIFDALLGRLAERFEIVALGDVAKETQPEGLEKVSPEDKSGACPVCREPLAHLRDYGAPKRQCAFCKSVERQRTLVDLTYAGAFGPQIFHGKRILHIAPGWAESLLLRRMLDCSITTLNIQPGCDLQADIQNMPEVASDQFDIVIASEVFRHVRDLDAALSELRRVLKPGGLLLCSDCLENADFGMLIKDRAGQASWYGEQALDKYGIGDFRRFGRKDWPLAFQKHFHARVLKAVDKATGADAWWLAAAPAKGASESDSFSAEILESNAGRILHDAACDPLGDFIPGFTSWESWRRELAKRSASWLKEVNLRMNFYPADADVPAYETPKWPSAYPSSYYPFDEQSFQFLLKPMLEDIGEGDSPQLRILVGEILRWAEAWGFYKDAARLDSNTSGMVWEDSCAAYRLGLATYAFLRAAACDDYSSADLEKLLRLMLDHYLLLASRNFFVDRNNHGWIQMLALLAFCKAIPEAAGASAAAGIAARRSLTLARRHTTKDGIYKEHSTEYQAAAAFLLRAVCALAPAAGEGREWRGELEAVSAMLLERFGCFLLPNGLAAAFGDTNPLQSEFRRELLPLAPLPGKPLNLFRESGYAFLRVPHSQDRAEDSYLAMTGAFYSINHKHCDELGFVWSEGGADILIDPGLQVSRSGIIYSGALFDKGFFYSGANNIFAESAHAHNVVEVDGETWSRKLKPWGALPIEARRLDAAHWLIAGCWRRPEGFLQKRRLVFAPRRWLLVLDSLAGVKKGEFAQWFHFGSQWQLAQEGADAASLIHPDGLELEMQSFTPGASLSLHKGEAVPRLQGWVAARSSRQLEPAWAAGWHLRGCDVEFRTLFSLAGPCERFALSGGHLALRFNDGEAVGLDLTDLLGDCGGCA